ncbi:hypothetical protein KC340_g14380 [Hortaea werneckii]|nr:hypothetical protein KC342_g14753 [Hortaea werneckii]KAI7066097.1 hypothetical protein KC339_g15602 [Hortaea werneckii]KAI7212419.1 hypothetical protein KC365_g14609 [Hortaea werneckii]KAI7298352.1 hypothetical protein KC340_g14380 [Hortaea werneckii]KAI7385930.1 hypothetical protein KC328_g10095 [Hortaea werneckii]
MAPQQSTSNVYCYTFAYEQRQKQDKQVIANLKRESARLAEIATEEENKVAKLEGMLAMHRLQKKPEVPAKPQADTKPKEKGSSTGPTLTLLGVQSWADIGFMQDLPSIQRQRKAKGFNHQVEGKSDWHENDELSQLFKKNNKWPPPGFRPGADGLMRKTDKAETDTEIPMTM